MGDPHGDLQTSPQHADPHGSLVWSSFKKSNAPRCGSGPKCRLEGSLSTPCAPPPPRQPRPPLPEHCKKEPGGWRKRRAGREGLWLERRLLQLLLGGAGGPPNGSWGQTHIWGLSKKTPSPCGSARWLWAGLRVAMSITHVGRKFRHGLVEKSLIERSLDGPNRQSPIASVQRTRLTLAGHSAGPRGTNNTPTNANRAIRIAAQRTQGLRGPNSVFQGEI